jgi:hypothetical protein
MKTSTLRTETGTDAGTDALFDNRWFRALTLWCGLWEVAHFALNINTLVFGATDFPPAPPEGWTAQTRMIFSGIVASDIIQAGLCIVFAVAFLMRKRWCFMLGLVCLGSSAFNSFSFTYFMVLTGAWAAHAGEYIGIQVLWAPLFVLFLWLCVAFSRGGAAGSSKQARDATLTDDALVKAG